MAKGSGGTRGAAGGGANGVGDESMKGMSVKLMKALKDREDTMRINDMFEMGAVFDEKGNMIFKNNRGMGSSVELGNDLKDRIVTHSHPSTDRLNTDVTLSPDDMYFAAYNNVKEMRAVTRHYTYSLKRPTKGWGVKSTDAGLAHMKATYEKAYAKVFESHKKYVENYKGDLSQASYRTHRLIGHQVNKEFAKMMGWKYTKTRVTNKKFPTLGA